LLIGGATTSKQHTAVKVAPKYEAPVVHVLDASRAVNVVSSLLSKEQRPEFDRKNREEQERIRSTFEGGDTRPLLSLEAARANRSPITWRAQDIAQPSFVGRRVIAEQSLRELVPYVDWTFFFTAWELNGRWPQILEHPKYGAEAKRLYDDALRLLEKLLDEGAIRARGVYGIWPAHAEGDDIVLLSDDRGQERARFPMLRAQRKQSDGAPNRCLADFVAPKGSGLADHVGAFAVTAGLGSDEVVARFKRDHDDYHAIMTQALCDRLAEAFAEKLHEDVRRLWNHGESTPLTNEERIAEKYRGIRPALGYPACPDHSEKPALFELLGAHEIGMGLTESFAMTPAASVSGLYLAHPEARYFSVSKIGRDQLEDYATRRGVDLALAERWLGPVL
jgi:5-methyltetrahydrofolate--homocysteine methyltransferase